MRLLLTGYADVASIMGAVNRGEIYRYIAKPWDDDEILLTLRGALDHQGMRREQRRLQAVVQQQNEDLKNLNANLEIKVHARTVELLNANDALHSSNERLKSNFITSIKVFSAVIELRNTNLAGHSRRTAELARRLAIKLGLASMLVQDVFVAGLLHEIGKVGFADVLLNVPVVSLSTAQLLEFRKYPAHATNLLMPLDELKGTIEIIGAQLERFDGAGYPNHWREDEIPIGSRILSVACDYDCLQVGALAQRKLDPSQAQTAILQGRGRRYDPSVVDAFIALQGGAPRALAKQTERTVASGKMSAGMVLSRDLVTPSGLLMMTAGHVLDDAVIKKLREFERSRGLSLSADVWQVNPDGVMKVEAP